MKHAIARFSTARGGSVATLFAFSLLPMLVLTGAAIDYSGALTLRATVQNASDSAILNLCHQPTTTTTAQLQSQAQSWINAVVNKGSVTVAPLTVTDNPRQITMISSATYPSYFGRIVGMSSIPVSARAQCTAPIPKVVEIALALDNTGSMAASSGSQSKIQALQQAAANFVDIIFSNSTGSAFDPNSKIAIVPFASAVAVDPSTYRNATWIDQLGLSAYHWTNISNATQSGFTNKLQIFDSLKTVNSNWGWAGCLESLPYPLNVQDGAPSLTNPSSFYVPYLSPDEPSNAQSFTIGNGRYPYPNYASNTNGTTSFGSLDVSFNNYLNDSTSQSNCSATPANEKVAAMQACKYVKPVAAPYNAAMSQLDPGPNFSCNGLPLLRLTNNVSQLKNEINAMTPDGNTDIHEGFMWGWRTISPRSVFADASAYNAKNTMKVIVLMTDGTNTWTSTNPYGSYGNWNTMYKSWYSAYGYFRNADGSTPNGRLPPGNANPGNDAQSRAAIDALTLEGCTNAKAAGITIYTVGFSVASDPIDQQGIDLLKACASLPSQAYVSNNSGDLVKAFNDIGNAIGALRLTQ